MPSVEKSISASRYEAYLRPPPSCKAHRVAGNNILQPLDRDQQSAENCSQAVHQSDITLRTIKHIRRQKITLTWNMWRRWLCTRSLWLFTHHIADATTSRENLLWKQLILSPNSTIGLPRTVTNLMYSNVTRPLLRSFHLISHLDVILSSNTNIRSETALIPPRHYYRHGKPEDL